MNKRK